MLHDQFAGRTAESMRKHNITVLFVMAHPYIRDFISEKLSLVSERRHCLCLYAPCKA